VAKTGRRSRFPAEQKTLTQKRRLPGDKEECTEEGSKRCKSNPSIGTEVSGNFRSFLFWKKEERHRETWGRVPGKKKGEGAGIKGLNRSRVRNTSLWAWSHW